MIQFSAQGWSDVGNVRKNNEDSILCDPESGLFVVCDGVGGHQGGEIASATAAQVIARELATHREQIDAIRKISSGVQLSVSDIERVESIIERAINGACREIYSVAQADSKLRGMATTVDLGVMVGNYCVLGHVGDSRTYLVRSGKCHRLTEDHTVASEMAKQGIIKPEDVETNPHASVLSRAVGLENAVQVDTLAVELMDGDYIFFCSDGLHDYFDDSEYTAHFPNQSGSLAGVIEKIGTEMVGVAKTRGGRDNISVVLASVYDRPTQPDIQWTKHGTTQDASESIAPSNARPTPELKAEVAKTIPLFQHLVYAEIIRVLQVADVRTFLPGEVLIQEGDQGSELLLTLNGEVEITKKGSVLATRGTGCVIGEMGLIDLSPRSASVVAKQLTDALLIPRERLFQLLRKEPRLATKILWALCHGLNSRLRETTDKLVELEAELQSRAHHSPGSDVPFTQGSL